MENNYIANIMTMFRDVTLNSEGMEKELYKCIDDKDIFRAVGLMDNNDKEVDKAIREYNTQTHPIMNRPNKVRADKSTYVTVKLPRNKQQYINEIELFFLLGKPILWKKEEGSDEAFGLYKDFWSSYRMNSLIRKAKRLAGAETESAIIFHLSRDGKGEVSVKPFVAARETGYRLRPLFDQYGDLIALAYGYRLRENGKDILHWDILTKDFVFYCKHTREWDVDMYQNPTGKINAVYFHQPKAWDGAVPRIEREETLDSKVGDTNNYFADPKAAATADVVANIMDPDIAGQMVMLSGKESRFEYINPPQNSTTRQDEKSDLHRSIFFDTLTPDLSYENIKGLGTLSGAALHNALILGYIKRDNRMEIYGEMVDRLRSVIVAILALQGGNEKDLKELKISHEFSDPFATKSENWEGIIRLYNAGLCSLETAVKEVGLVDDIDDEIDRIMMKNFELECAKLEAQASNERIKDENNRNQGEGV